MEDTINFEDLKKRLSFENKGTWAHNLLPFDHNRFDKNIAYCFDGKIYVHYLHWEELVFHYFGSSEQALDLIFNYHKEKLKKDINRLVISMQIAFKLVKELKDTGFLVYDTTLINELKNFK